MFIASAYGAITKPRKFGSCQCALNAPPECETVIDHVSWKAGFFCPFWYSQRFSIESKLADVPAISILDLSSKYPLAISRLVISVVVQAFNRMLCRRTRPHVSIEHFKGITPFLADFNSSAAIVVVSVVSFIFTAANHVTPHAIFRTPRETVCCVSLGCCSGRQAAATLGTTCNEAVFFYHSQISAFAYTLPQPPAMACEHLGSSEFEHMQFTKNAIAQIAV